MPKPAAAVAAGRLSFGVSLPLRPKVVGRCGWATRSKVAGRGWWCGQSGACDAIVGCAALCAMCRGRPAHGWLEAGVATDALDTVIALG